MNKIKKKHTALLFSVAALGIWACTSSNSGTTAVNDTTAVKDNTVNFALYKTFSLVEPPDDVEQPGTITEGVRLAVIDTLRSELKAVGLKEVADAESADLKATSFIKVKTVDSTATGYWYEIYYWGWYWDYNDYWYEDDEVQFDMGTLIVDVVDSTKPGAADDKLIFRGVSMGVVSNNPAEAPERVKSAIKEIFTFWPVK
jgi:hypothetical protein